VSASRISKELFVFDLDGTLIDATEDIIAAVNHTLTHFKRPHLTRPEIVIHIGHGVRNLLQNTLGLGGAEFEPAMEIMLSYYYDHCLETTQLYPAVGETLKTLYEKKKKLSVCTNKSIKHTERILHGFKIRDYFTTVVGGNSFPERKPHPMGLNHILAENRIPAVHAVMVGDSAVDIAVGKAVGLTTVGCTYGLRPLTEVQQARPDFLLNRFDDLLYHFH